MEYLHHGDLQHYMRSSIPEIEVQQIASQLLEGVQFLHDNNFAHRDLKPTVSHMKSSILTGTEDAGAQSLNS